MKEISAVLRGENLLDIFASDKMAIKQGADNTATQIEMRVLAYGDKYQAASNWSMEVMEGTFTESLADMAVGNEYAHCYGDGHEGNATKILANTKNPADQPGGMEFYEGGDGLYARVTLPDTTAGRDISTLLKAGVIGNVSIGMYVDEMEYIEEAGEDDDETFYRGEIRAARIVEVSFVHRGKFDSAHVLSVSDVEAKLDAGVMTCANPTVAEVNVDNPYAHFSQDVRSVLKRIESRMDDGWGDLEVSGNGGDDVSKMKETARVSNAVELLIGAG